MARFLVGLILGFFLGALAAAYEPTLPTELRAALADATTLVARDTEKAAQSLGHEAGRVTDQAQPAGQGPPSRNPAPPPTDPAAR
jgi:hypothetical protein